MLAPAGRSATWTNDLKSPKWCSQKLLPPMKITYYGHACFAVETTRHRLLFDPFISPNPLAKDIDLKAIEADFIFVSHGHGDHIADCVAIAERTRATVISNFEVGEWLEKKGVKKTMAMNHGGAARTDFGRVKLTNAIHSSSLPDGSYGGNPVGFLVQTEDGNFYYSGDTALTLDMRLVAKGGLHLTFAALPIGDYFTMGVDDAIIAADYVGTRTVLGLHYNTFPPITINPAEAQKKALAAGIDLLLPKIGQTISAPHWSVVQSAGLTSGGWNE
jgi:L-ascorbate metabolism protein UlaG (beta-lactamase superfamily)